MSKLSGMMLVVAGVAAATYLAPSQTDEARRSGANSSAAVAPAARPAAPVTTASVTEAVKPTPQIVPPAPVAATRPSLDSAAAAPAAPVPAPQRITIVPAPKTAAVEATPAPTPMLRRPSASKIDDSARKSLTQDLQRELKRVGCYDGEINGEWSAQSRNAVKAFTDRVNATLPIDEPDHILLTLVQGHSARACGRACPQGQTASAIGKCVPQTVTAGVAPPRPEQAKPEKAVKPARVETKSIARVEPATPRTPEIVAPSIARLPTRPIETPAPVAAGVTPPAEPLPGRMAVGAMAPDRVEDTSIPAKPAKPEQATKGTPPQKVAAVPNVQNEAQPEAKPEPKSTETSTPRPVSRRVANIPPPIVYVPAPRQRYAPTYYAPSAFIAPPPRAAPRFGPSIFTRLQREGR